MTAVTLPFSVPLGGQSVKLTDGANNTPAGLTLVNRGDNGATVWISTSPALSAAAIPLGPGATLQWTDPAVFPYAALSGSATAAETIVVTSQATGYANPSVVAAALIARGIPSTMLDTGYGTFRIFSGGSSIPLAVGQSSSLLVAVSWPQPTPTGVNVLRLRFDDPAVPDLPAIDYYLTNNNAVEAGLNKWQVPVVAPRLTVTNVATPDHNNADAYVSIVGSNRSVPRLRQVGGEIGVKNLAVNFTAANVTLGPLLPGNSNSPAPNAGIGPNPAIAGLGPMTRFNGPVVIQVFVNVSTPCYLQPTWADESGGFVSPRFALNGSNDYTLQWIHPTVPVYWQALSTSPPSGFTGVFRVTVLGSE